MCYSISQVKVWFNNEEIFLAWGGVTYTLGIFELKNLYLLAFFAKAEALDTFNLKHGRRSHWHFSAIFELDLKDKFLPSAWLTPLLTL